MTDFRKWMSVVAVLVAVWCFYKILPILTPFALAALLAYLGDPIVERLVKWKLPRTLAVVLVFLIMAIILLDIVVWVFPMLLKQLNHFVERLPVLIHWLQTQAIPWLNQKFSVHIQIDLTHVRETLAKTLKDNMQVAPKFFSVISHSGLALIAFITNLLLVPVVAFYLMRDWGKVLTQVHKLIPRKIEKTVLALAKESNEVVGAFLRGQFLVMIALAITYSTGLWIAGLHFALLVGLLAGLAAIVPYLGFIVGLSAGFIAAWLQFHSITVLVYVLIVFLVGQALESMLFTPLLVGDRIGLHPVAVIFSVMVGGANFGFLGVLLALPIAAIIMVLLRFAANHYHNSEFYLK